MFLLAGPLSAQNVAPTGTDRTVLETLYTDTGGANWTDSTNWNTDDGDWYGVTTDSSGNVTELLLHSNQLSGSIPTELEDLASLTVLYLHSNQLGGSIPMELGELENLRSLYLGGNDLSGSIPMELGDLENLTELNLDDNRLSGSIPMELGDLTNLTELDLGSNNLSGSIPAVLGDLTSLDRLDLHSNNLSGSIPAALGNLTRLTRLDLANNHLLDESIPPELKNLTRLTVLDLSSNALTGNIPAELKNLTSLTRLSLYENALDGSIPAALGDLTNLDRLDLSGNNLTGSIPAALRDLTNLTRLSLDNNALTGGIPPALEDLTNLVSLHLQNNADLSGPFSSRLLTALTALQELHLQNTSITVSTAAAVHIRQEGIAFTSGARDDGSPIALDPENTVPRGLWSDETTLYVSDLLALKVFAYVLADGSRDMDKDIRLVAANSSPQGLWSDGTTLWVADFNDDKVFAYTLAGRSHDADKDIPVTIPVPRGLWANETTLWVVHPFSAVEAYTLADGSRDADSDLALAATSREAYGIFSNGTRVWISDLDDDGLYAYTLANGAHDPVHSRILDPANSTPRGLWWDGTKLYVVDARVGEVFVYANSPPVATDDSATVAVDTEVSIQVLANDTDPDGDSISVTAITQPANGTAAITSSMAQTTYTPDTGYLGTDTFEYTVADSLGSTDTATVTVTITTTGENAPPAFTATTATRTLAENTAAGEDIGAPLTATDPDGNVVTYSLSGTDADSFSIVSETTGGQLQTKDGVTYDYETKASYAVTVTATDLQGGGDTDTITVTISLTNADDPGTLSLSAAPPRVGSELTASLSDPDGGVSVESWEWHRSLTGTGGWSLISAATAAAYTPEAADANHYLRATAAYTDEHGPGKTAQARTAAPVPSTDVTLSAIRVNGTAIAGFDPATTTYIVGVQSTVDQATLSATPTDASASVAYSSDDTDNGTDVSGGHRVTFSATANSFTITITVTAADAITPKTYTVTVRRGTTTDFDWNVNDDIVLNPDNAAPTGVWSDGETIWVADADDARLYAYTLATGARRSSRDFTTLQAAGNTDPYGVWSDGTTLWVVDATVGKLYAYRLATRVRASSRDIELDTPNAAPTGLWSDGETIWVADADDAQLYAYSLATGDADSSQDILLAAANEAPTGVWADGVTLWVADKDDATLYAYTYTDTPADGSRDSSQDIDLEEAGNTSPSGVWADCETVWVADRAAARLYSYNLPVSDNTGLRSIRVGDTAVTSTTTSYRHTVANTVAQLTVAPRVRQCGATAAITSPADAVSDTAGHQLALSAGANPVALTVTAQDEMATQAYSLTVTRTNSPPVFAPPPALRIPENTAAGADIGDPITATDEDGNPVTYSLGGTDATAFGIVSTTGQLQTKAALDYETTDSYAVTVTATDSLNTTATIAVTISIIDVNEPAVFAPTTDNTRSFPENTAAGEDIGAEFTATDPEMTDLTYTLAGDDVGSFSLVSASTGGQIQTKSDVTYDYETKASYAVIVLARDDNQDTATQIAVTIRVIDVDEAGTVSLSSAAPQAQTPLTATLSDPDYDSGGIGWKWEQSATGDAPWTTISTATSASYTPVAGDVNRYLRVTASYTDRHDPQTAQTVSGQVQAAPVVELVLSDSSIAEQSGKSTVTARLTGGTSGRATVITLRRLPNHYTLSGTTLTIPTGTTASSGSGVTLTAQDNAVDAADAQVDVTGSTPNPQVTGPAAVTLTIEDNDTRGVTVSETALTVREGGTQTYTVVLTSAPTAPVTIGVGLAAGASEDVSVAPLTLSFPPTTWATAQEVTVTAAQDSDAIADTATLTHTVSGGDYSDTLTPAADVAVTVEDDEADSTAVDLTLNPATLGEGAGAQTVTVTGTLNGRALTADLAVPLSVTADTATLGTDFTVASVGSLPITAGQQSGTATFRLTPKDDAIDEPDETVAVGGTTTTSLAVRGAPLTITDNDAPPTVSLVLSPASIDEDGGETTITARLDHPSSAATEVTLSATAESPATATDFTLSGTTLTIPAAAEESDSVTLTPTSNTADGPDKIVTLSGTATNDNPGIRGPEAVELTITDDDPPEVSGEASPAYVEHETKPVATYTATNPAGVTMTWDVTEPDAVAFRIDENGVLHFRASPDHEASRGPVYQVTVTASDGTLSGELDVSVTVVDAPGTLSLSSAAPQVGRVVIARLSDPDDGAGPATNLTWGWARSTDPEAPDTEWEDLGQDADRYTPRFGDVLYYVRATVDYTDGAGTAKTGVQVISDEAVRATPRRPVSRPPSGGGGGGGGGAPAEEPSAAPVGYLENPGPSSFQSGIGLLSGWVCEADVVELELNGEQRIAAAYGTARADTAGVCRDTDNGFGLLFNWNLLGDGVHTVRALADGVAFSQATFTVTTLGEEFVRDATGATVLADFPGAGDQMRLAWQEANQNFVLAPLDTLLPPASLSGPRDGPLGVLENPGPGSFQSGIGLLSGWVCEADVVELAINDGPRIAAAYGTARADTVGVCDDHDNGFGLLFNWNLLGDGTHTVVALADGEEFGRATVRVTTLGTEFLQGVEGEGTVVDFPTDGETVLLEWQQNSQNFVITDVE